MMLTNDGLALLFKVLYKPRFRGLELSWHVTDDQMCGNVKLVMSVRGRYTGEVHTEVVTINMDDMLMSHVKMVPVLDKVADGTAALISRAHEIHLQPPSRFLSEDAYNLV